MEILPEGKIGFVFEAFYFAIPFSVFSEVFIT